MDAGAPPSSPDPHSSRVVPLSDPVAMPSPPVVPPSDLVAMPSPPPPASPAAAEEDEERPWPAKKMKLFPYAMFCVFGGMGETGNKLLLAFIGIQYLNIIASLLSFYTIGGYQARFWALVSSVTQFLCIASSTLITCVFIRYYMRVDGEYHIRYYMRADGEYHVTFDPPQQHLAPAAAAEAEQLPPPSPEMDMC